MGSVVWLPDAYVSLYWETASVAAAVTPMAYVVLAYMTFWLVMDAFESRSRPR
jgi:phage shock protein PspC (stress-responsive transcriptional regulator)